MLGVHFETHYCPLLQCRDACHAVDLFHTMQRACVISDHCALVSIVSCLRVNTACNLIADDRARPNIVFVSSVAATLRKQASIFICQMTGYQKSHWLNNAGSP